MGQGESRLTVNEMFDIAKLFFYFLVSELGLLHFVSTKSFKENYYDSSTRSQLLLTKRRLGKVVLR